MSKKYKIATICFAILFLTANIYFDFFAGIEPKYWETVRFI